MEYEVIMIEQIKLGCIAPQIRCMEFTNFKVQMNVTMVFKLHL